MDEQKISTFHKPVVDVSSFSWRM